MSTTAGWADGDLSLNFNYNILPITIKDEDVQNDNIIDKELELEVQQEIMKENSKAISLYYDFKFDFSASESDDGSSVDGLTGIRINNRIVFWESNYQTSYRRWQYDDSSFYNEEITDINILADLIIEIINNNDELYDEIDKWINIEDIIYSKLKESNNYIYFTFTTTTEIEIWSYTGQPYEKYQIDEECIRYVNSFDNTKFQVGWINVEINTSTNSLFILTDEIKLLVKLDNVVWELNFKDLNEQLYRSFDRN